MTRPSRARAGAGYARRNRVSAYAAIRGTCTAQQAAYILGVSRRTIERYEAELKKERKP
jgi:predicted DNA-binding transcriptional regulator YafY